MTKTVKAIQSKVLVVCELDQCTRRQHKQENNYDHNSKDQLIANGTNHKSKSSQQESRLNKHLAKLSKYLKDL